MADRAGISKALIYKYFAKREELLKDMLEREFKALSGRGLDSIPEHVPIEQVIRGTVERAMRYYHDHGPILRLLSADPGVANLTLARNRTSRSSTTDYFVKRLIKHYRVPKDVALIAVTLVVNAPIHSMAYLHRQDIDIERTIDVWTEFIIGVLGRHCTSASANRRATTPDSRWDCICAEDLYLQSYSTKGIAMNYSANRIIYDADSHVMETREWLDPFMDADLKSKLAPLYGHKPGRIDKILDQAKARKGDLKAQAKALDNPIAGPKGWIAAGAFDPDERIQVLDQFGFSGQLVFGTAGLGARARRQG